MKRRVGTKLFPPPVGWLPILVAILVLVGLSLWSVAPNFDNRVVGSRTIGQGGSGDPNNPVTQASAAASADPNHPNGTVSQHGPTIPPGVACAAGKNGGSTAPGVTATQIRVASTVVKTGVGAGFLGEAESGMRAAISEVNSHGGICGRIVNLDTVNDGWVGTTGAQDINNYINSGSIFALVGEPDSEGLDQAVRSGSIDRAEIPVVGTDGMLKSQYHDPWVWPVAASTVTNMHIIAKYAVDHGAKTFGIVFDTSYKFGAEGANAFDQEVKRLTGSDIPGFDPSLSACKQQFCGIPSNVENGQTAGYGQYINTFDNSCGNANGGGKPCDAVVMLLEPQPMQTWMLGERNCNCTWYKQLVGGEPLFDDTFGHACGSDCADMQVWTGYHPGIQPFDTEKAVYTYEQSLKATCATCDPHNEFTEGAYLGTKMFLDGCARVGPVLTRSALRDILDSATFSFGLSGDLHYGSSLPHLANKSMAAFAANAQQNGSFNGWNYLGTNFIDDPAPGSEL